jgi:hypothetical protein
MFGHHGLLMLDAADPAVRKLESDMFTQLFSRRSELSASFGEASEQMRALGYAESVKLQPGQAHLFLENDGQRQMLFDVFDSQTNQSFLSDRQHSFRMTEAELFGIATEQPYRLSNNVLTRPLMQQFLLPVIGVVLGRAELAYWSLLPRAFEQLDMAFPIPVLRHEFTIIEPPIERALAKTGLTFSKVTSEYESAKTEWLQSQGVDEWKSHFSYLKQTVTDLYSPLLQQLDNLNAGIAQLGRQNLEKVIEQMQFLEKRTLSAAEQRHDTFLKQWGRLHQALYPLGKPQERVYNVVAYVNRNGREWLDHLLQTAETIAPGRHYLVFVNATFE